MKQARRFGQPLSFTAKEAKILQRRGYPPGVHGPSASGRKSEYATQLLEKQKAKLIYGILERQFQKYYTEAFKQTGNTGEGLLSLLERRLDNVVYRSGFATTRAQARQLVTHGHMQVNGRRVNIPSYQVRVNDLVTIRPQSSAKKIFAELSKTLTLHQPPAWLKVDPTAINTTVTALPTRADVEMNIDPQLIIEFYSR